MYLHAPGQYIRPRSVMKLLPDQKLGISGNTGYRTTGEHLHFGVISISTNKKCDPAAYLAEISQKGTSHYRFSVTEKI